MAAAVSVPPALLRVLQRSGQCLDLEEEEGSQYTSRYSMAILTSLSLLPMQGLPLGWLQLSCYHDSHIYTRFLAARQSSHHQKR